MLKNHGYWKFEQYASVIFLMLFIRVQCILALNYRVVTGNHSYIHYNSTPVNTSPVPLRFEKQQVILENTPMGTSRKSSLKFQTSSSSGMALQRHSLQSSLTNKDRHLNAAMLSDEKYRNASIFENKNYVPRAYSERKPFEETLNASTLTSSTTILSSPMRATEEDDPDFPGDPGQMPVGDGVWFLIGAVVIYVFLKKRLVI